MNAYLPSLLMLACLSEAHAQLAVTVFPPKVTGQNAVVPLSLRNDLNESVESARAVVFLLDEHGKMLAQATRWVVGGGEGRSKLAAGATNSFQFVIASDKLSSTSTLTAKVTFSRVVLDGGKAADVTKSVQIEHAGK